MTKPKKSKKNNHKIADAVLWAESALDSLRENRPKDAIQQLLWALQEIAVK